VKAVVELRSGFAPDYALEHKALEKELIGYCAEKLAKYKVPRTIDFVAQMPRDPNGKLYKRKLRDPYWAGQTKAI
jgi:long-chain acyl-CoA synthetase